MFGLGALYDTGGALGGLMYDLRGLRGCEAFCRLSSLQAVAGAPMARVRSGSPMRCQGSS